MPSWLQGVLPSDKAVVHYREVGGKKQPPWEKKPFREQSWVVCESCNTGWMSRLEDEAKRVLAPAISRERACEFGLHDQWVAARWAVKTCYVFQAQSPHVLVPSVHPILLKENAKPPQQVTVWIGSHARAVDDPINSVYVQQPLTILPAGEHRDQPVDFGYMCFLAVGGISFLVVGHRFGSYVECALDG